MSLGLQEQTSASCQWWTKNIDAIARAGDTLLSQSMETEKYQAGLW